MPKTLLIVDDEQDSREMLALLLGKHGYHVDRCDSGAAALTLLEQSSDIAMVISDVAMPKMDGIELAERARKLRPDVQVILTTGHDSVVTRAVADGIIVLPKPYETQRLLGLVREWLGLPDR